MVRALRHGLVVSGVCVLIALVTGLSGYAFGESPPRAHGETVVPREGAATSFEVLNRWLRPLTDGEPAAGGGASLVTVEPALELAAEAVIDVASTMDEQPLDSAGGRVRAQRLQVSTPELALGDRPRVTVSFYYCEEAAGGYNRGDGGGFCGRARDGSYVRPGVAACDPAYLGQRFRIEGDPTGRVYTCADTGSAVHGMHRDIWFLDNRDGWGWQSAVGAMATIEVVR